MKKPYKTPKLTIHGNIENLTQGPFSMGESSDTSFFGGQSFTPSIPEANKLHDGGHNSSFDFAKSDLDLGS